MPYVLPHIPFPQTCGTSLKKYWIFYFSNIMISFKKDAVKIEKMSKVIEKLSQT
jgi:hypothetical protein